MRLDRGASPDWTEHIPDSAWISMMIFRDRTGLVLKPVPLRAGHSDIDESEVAAAGLLSSRDLWAGYLNNQPRDVSIGRVDCLRRPQSKRGAAWTDNLDPDGRGQYLGRDMRAWIVHELRSS